MKLYECFLDSEDSLEVYSQIVFCFEQEVDIEWIKEIGEACSESVSDIIAYWIKQPLSYLEEQPPYNAFERFRIRTFFKYFSVEKF